MIYYEKSRNGDSVGCDFGRIIGNKGIIYASDEVEIMKSKNKGKGNFILVDIKFPESYYPNDGFKEIAVIVVESYKLVDSLDLVNINDKESYKKYDGSRSARIEDNKELKNEFKELIKRYNYPLVSHNARLDKEFLEYWGWIEKDQEFYSSMDTIRYNIKLDSYELPYLLEHFGIKIGGIHNVVQQVIDLYELLKIIKPETWI